MGTITACSEGLATLLSLKARLEDYVMAVTTTATTAEATKSDATKSVQTYKTYIKATPQRIWDALTQPEWSERYGYAPLVDYELREGGRFRAYPNDGMKAAGAPDVVIDGKVTEARPPRKLVQTWRMLMDPATSAEGFTDLKYEIEPVRGGVTKLTVTHDLTGAPKLNALLLGESESSGAGGGWSEVLSGLKTLLETGSQLPFQSGPERR
jgi:uncharacterized protein YndB with AHSA1/START domain